MRDSLDLELLQSQIIAERKAARLTWVILIALSVILALLVVGFLVASLQTSPGSRPPCAQSASCSTIPIRLAIATLPAFIVTSVILAFAVNWWRRRNRTNKIRQQLPKLTLPPPIRSYENEIVVAGIIALVSIGLIGKLEFEAVLFAILSHQSKMLVLDKGLKPLVGTRFLLADFRTLA